MTRTGRPPRHGMSLSPIWRSWESIISRCIENKRPDNPYRGMYVDPRWLTFENFYEDMNEGFAPDLTIDRIDNAKGYFKANCRWATKREQANNRSSNRWLVFQGEERTMAEWERHLGFPRCLIYNRLSLGWSTEKTLTTPYKKPNKTH